MSSLTELTDRIKNMDVKRVLERLCENDTAGWSFSHEEDIADDVFYMDIKFALRGNLVASYHMMDDKGLTSGRIETVSTDLTITKRIIKFMERSLEKAIDLDDEIKEKHEIAMKHVASRLSKNPNTSGVSGSEVLWKIDSDFSKLNNPKPFSEIVDGVIVELTPSTSGNGDYVQLSFYAPVSGVADPDAKARMGEMATGFENYEWSANSRHLNISQIFSLAEKVSVMVQQRLTRQDAAFGEERAAIADREFERAKKLSAEVSQNLAESFGI